MYNTKNKTQSAYRKNKPTLNLVPKNCVCVFPIELVGGKTQVSNLGIMPNRRYYDKGSFLYWQEVFDGRSALKIQWEGSIWLDKPEGQNYYLSYPTIGKYYYGKPISSGGESLEISEDASFEEFMSMKASQTITLKFEYTPTNRSESKEELQKFFRFSLVDNDMYNLYLIPEICEEKLMYIEDHQEYYDDETGLAKGCEITFATLGDKIQKSGKAIEQYCSWNAPGEFAVKPIVEEVPPNDGSEEYVRVVNFDYSSYYTPTPIKYLQVEQQGPALTSTIYALGRRQEWDEENECWRIGPSKFLFASDFISTQPNPLNRTATPTKNFDVFYDEEVAMITSNDWLKWQLDTSGQPLERVKNGGMITIGKKTDWSGLSLGQHKSNPIQTQGEGEEQVKLTRYDYYSKVWTPFGSDFLNTEPTYDTSGCVYAENTIQMKGTDTLVDIMCKNAFIFNQMPIIPLSMVATKPLYLRDIPLVGAIANFFKIGDIHLKNNTTNSKSTHLCFFGDADIMGMCANLAGQVKADASIVQFPINFFGTNEAQYNKLGVNSVNTTFCMELTDKVQITTHGTTETYDTILLGQSKSGPDTYIFQDKASLLANSTIKPVKLVSKNQANFIIDAVVVQSIFDGKIRLSCYGEDEIEFIYPQWTATILSNANWEGGNMRDWTNIFPLSNWEERFCYQQDKFTWPEAPHKDEEGTYLWNVQAKSELSIPLNNDRFYQTFRSNISQSQQLPTRSEIMYSQDNTNFTIAQNTIAYSDLGDPEVTDKTSFLAKYTQAELDFSRCYLSMKNGQGNSNVSFGDKLSFTVADLQQGVKVAPTAIWAGHTPVIDETIKPKKMSKFPGVVLAKYLDKQQNGSYANIKTMLTITLTLNDYTMVFSAIDNTQYTAYYNSIYANHNVKFTNGPYTQTGPQLRYGMYVNTIKFKE